MDAKALADHIERAVDADLWFGDGKHIDGKANLTNAERSMIVLALRAYGEREYVDGTPSGWTLVPNDPTPKMIEELNGYAVCAGYIEKGYRAMLKAAPKPEPSLYDEWLRMQKVLSISNGERKET